MWLNVSQHDCFFTVQMKLLLAASQSISCTNSCQTLSAVCVYSTSFPVATAVCHKTLHILLIRQPDVSALSSRLIPFNLLMRKSDKRVWREVDVESHLLVDLCFGVDRICDRKLPRVFLLLSLDLAYYFCLYMNRDDMRAYQLHFCFSIINMLLQINNEMVVIWVNKSTCFCDNTLMDA